MTARVRCSVAVFEGCVVSENLKTRTILSVGEKHGENPTIPPLFSPVVHWSFCHVKSKCVCPSVRPVHFSDLTLATFSIFSDVLTSGGVRPPCGNDYRRSSRERSVRVESRLLGWRACRFIIFDWTRLAVGGVV